jgi:superfamily II DNA helicase RecQ
MAPKYRWCDPEGLRTTTRIVKEQIHSGTTGSSLYPSQDNLVRRVLDGEAIVCCMATGGGKSALFTVPILILREMARNHRLYPDLPTRVLPQGIVVTPRKGLAANIVRLDSTPYPALI